MNKSETISEMILTKHNWQPTKTNGNLHISGLPDFRCNNDRYVEVKKIVSNQYFIQIQDNQIKKWMELIKDKKQIYLMIFTHNNEYLTTFEIKKGDGIYVENKL